jgi:hypothetical protein
MTIEQTIEIPQSRRITVTLPQSVPTGTAKLTLFTGEVAKKPVKMSRQARKLLQYYGCLKNSPVFEGDPVEIQRKMRSEWERSWDTDGQA